MTTITVGVWDVACSDEHGDLWIETAIADSADEAGQAVAEYLEPHEEIVDVRPAAG